MLTPLAIISLFALSDRVRRIEALV